MIYLMAISVSQVASGLLNKDWEEYIEKDRCSV
jgi:hypothetical protein